MTYTITGEVAMKVRQYPATLNRVVDGDTVILKTDLGFHVFSDICFRLARINCPEVGTPKAQEAKAFTLAWCSGKNLRVLTSKGDRYGRWIAEVFHDDGDDTSVPLSSRLLEASLAEPYPKPKAPEHELDSFIESLKTTPLKNSKNI